MGARLRELLKTPAEHEQEQQRLHERSHDPHAVAHEPDQLAPPDDLHRAQLAADAARRHAHADDFGLLDRLTLEQEWRLIEAALNAARGEGS